MSLFTEDDLEAEQRPEGRVAPPRRTVIGWIAIAVAVALTLVLAWRPRPM